MPSADLVMIVIFTNVESLFQHKGMIVPGLGLGLGLGRGIGLGRGLGLELGSGLRIGFERLHGVTRTRLLCQHERGMWKQIRARVRSGFG